jgi:hypothetical protein
MPQLARVLFALSLAACATDRFLPPGSVVPPLDGDPELLARVETADAVQALVHRTHGFSMGETIWYWDLGPVAGELAMPVYVLCRTSGSRCEPVDHPKIAEALPGTEGYVPFGWIHEVPVTERWTGQVIPSALALEDARRAGLVEAPEPTGFAVELSIVHPDVRLEVGPGDATVPPNATVYAEGLAAPAFDFEEAHGRIRLVDPEAGRLLVRNVYVLTRDGETMPILERMRGMDLTGDGDLSDSNNLLGTRPGEGDYSSLWHVVQVTVPAAYASIDTAMDDAMAEARAATDLFTIAPDYTLEPIAGRVVDFTIEPRWVSCPVQSAPGAL